MATCLDVRTGELHWQERVGGGYSASPLYAAGRIYLQNEEGKGVVLEAGTEFRRLAENDVEARTLASPVPTPDGLLIRTESALHLFGESR